MRVGFTGTRQGMTKAQYLALRRWLYNRQLDLTELHHGDCIGADAQAHGLARSLGLWIVGHPPIDPRYRAYCNVDEELEPQEYLERNHSIVLETFILLAAPKGHTEQHRGSGTWATVRWAYNKGGNNPPMLFLPDGKIIAYDWIKSYG